jgi:hypothetical protein
LTPSVVLKEISTMKNADSWKVFNALAKEFADAAEHGATPFDFNIFMHVLRNGLPEGKETVYEVLDLDNVAEHEAFLVSHAKEELSRILQ